MESDLEADYLAKGLYDFRRLALLHLLDQDPLPDYLAAPLSRALDSVQAVIQELEKRHNCREESVINLGLANGIPE